MLQFNGMNFEMNKENMRDNKLEIHLEGYKQDNKSRGF